MCVPSRSLPNAVEAVGVILLTISVLTIGATLHLYDTTAEKLASLVICLLNILFNISLVFGVKDRSPFFILLWMVLALCNILGAIVIFGFFLYNENNYFNDSYYTIALNLTKAILLVLYAGLYIWSWIQAYNLYKKLTTPVTESSRRQTHASISSCSHL